MRCRAIASCSLNELMVTALCEGSEGSSSARDTSSGGAVDTSSTCEIKALVTQNIRGPHNLTIDDFTSEVGPSAPAFTTFFTSSE